MAKTKKKGLSEKVRGRKKDGAVKTNPFEVKTNRQKHAVLGQKYAKDQHGMPGVSRSKAIKKRKETLLVEFKERKKSNQFVDKRFGENDPEMGLEDRMLQRFTKERQKSAEHGSLFSLADDDEEELTHYGQSLSEIEKFEDPVESDDEEGRIGNRKDGKIPAKVVREEHFGGFLTKKDGEEEKPEEKPKSYKERMEEIIAKSKKEKYDRQHEREKNIEMTEKLDKDWKELQMLIKSLPSKQEEKPVKKDDKDYDMKVQELKFEMRGTPSERLKTEEEFAKEDAERLAKLEEDRCARMRGVVPDGETEPGQAKHRSADDLDDGFSLMPLDKKQVNFQVAYKDGQLLKEKDDKDENKEGMEGGDDEEKDDDDDDDSDSGSDEEESNEEEGDEGSDDNDFTDKTKELLKKIKEEMKKENKSDKSKPTKEKKEKVNKKIKEEKSETVDDESDDEDDEDKVEDEDDESESDDDDAMERTSDLESEGDDDADASDGEEKKTETGSPKKEKSILKKTEDFQRVLKERKEVMEKARTELPYTFKAPEKYADLRNLLDEHNDEEQITIVERLRKCHHPSLAEGNKTKLEALFSLLLRYYGDLAISEPAPKFSLMQNLIPHLYQLSQMSPLPAGLAMLDILKTFQCQLTEYSAAHGGRGLMPGLDTLMLLKLSSLLFPTSDLHHHVITPAMLLMSQILTTCPINTRRDISAGLFICNLFLEYVSLSKRLVPEVVTFLCGCLFLAADKEEGKYEPVIHPFKPIGRNINFLKLTTGKKARELPVTAVKLSDVFSKRRALYLGSEQFRVNTIHQVVSLLARFQALYAALPAAADIFSPVAYFCGKMHIDNYPTQIQSVYASLVAGISECSSQTRRWLAMHKQEAQSIEMFEPKFDDVFDGRKRHAGSKVQIEHKKLVYKHKKEMKGAIREIRKDSSFLAREKLQDTMQKDATRKRKVKELYAELANQEGEYKAMKHGKTLQHK